MLAVELDHGQGVGADLGHDPKFFVRKRLLDKWLNIRIAASAPPQQFLPEAKFVSFVNLPRFSHDFLNGPNGVTLSTLQYALPKSACPGPPTSPP